MKKVHFGQSLPPPTNRMMMTTMAVMTMTMMTTSTRTKMGGLEGTNRLGGRAEQPITPLHTSNPKPTLHSRCPHATSVTLHFSVQSESSHEVIQRTLYKCTWRCQKNQQSSLLQWKQCMAYMLSRMEASEEKYGLAHSLIF